MSTHLQSILSLLFKDVVAATPLFIHSQSATQADAIVIGASEVVAQLSAEIFAAFGHAKAAGVAAGVAGAIAGAVQPAT